MGTRSRSNDTPSRFSGTRDRAYLFPIITEEAFVERCTNDSMKRIDLLCTFVHLIGAELTMLELRNEVEEVHAACRHVLSYDLTVERFIDVMTARGMLQRVSGKGESAIYQIRAPMATELVTGADTSEAPYVRVDLLRALTGDDRLLFFAVLHEICDDALRGRVRPFRAGESTRRHRAEAIHHLDASIRYAVRVAVMVERYYQELYAAYV